MDNILGRLFGSFLGVILDVLQSFFCYLLFLLVVILALFFVVYRINPFRMDPQTLRDIHIQFKYYDLLRWLLVDFLERDKHRGEFQEYGFTFFVGRQGAGKTISMVYYLERMKERYPDCLVVANFDYYRADKVMTDWRDLLNIRNFGAKSIEEVKDKLISMDLNLKL